jgi:hypothetical protein
LQGISSDFFIISSEIIRDILKNYKILIKLTFWSVGRSKLLDYYNISDQIDYIPKIRNKFGNINSEENGMLLKSDDEFIILSSGKNIPITPVDIEKSYIYCGYKIYGLNTDEKVDTFKDANDLINKNKYDISMDYGKFPYHIEISLRPDKIDLFSIIKIVIDICTKHKKYLKIKMDKILTSAQS